VSANLEQMHEKGRRKIWRQVYVRLALSGDLAHAEHYANEALTKFDETFPSPVQLSHEHLPKQPPEG
jgi:hypothetical protein